MLKRTATGACYVAVLTAIFLLRQFVDYRIFHALTCFFAVYGTFELARALKSRVIKGSFTASIIYSALFVPLYCIGEYLVKNGWGWLFAIDLTAIMLIVVSVYSLIKSVDGKTFISTILLYVYPTLFLLTMLLANDLESNAFIALLMAFVVSPCSDTMAYLTGSLIGGPKLCPKLSPKKTWAGAIGGTVGGILSAIIVYFIFTPKVNFFSPILLFVLVGFFASILTLFGDLFESYIKRKVGIKDMGKLLPGHGGVLDRIDGTLFAIVLCWFVFWLV
ncbi:MAG: CDP-archaeol synthase [Clostridia bacterium]|nr:CDP-archaeol synthase [Clostridia bacterium]